MLLFSVTKGSDVSLWTFSLHGQEGDALRTTSTRRRRPAPCSRPTDDGSPTRARNGARRRSTSSHSRPPGPGISSPRKGPTRRSIRAGHRTARNCSTIRGTADSRPSASRRSRRLRSGMPCAVPKPLQSGSRRLANALRHHAGRQVRGSRHAPGQKEFVRGSSNQIQRRPQLVRGAQGASVPPPD